MANTLVNRWTLRLWLLYTLVCVFSDGYAGILSHIMLPFYTEHSKLAYFAHYRNWNSLAVDQYIGKELISSSKACQKVHKWVSL